ncbi:acyl transferase/acyl hydrolase/lysophospholipase [Microdochium trichocladiopsis]|uniref:Acyl transferase/acyl hydrolase/lysophospholipase n=1 Tax=Microdochium trichocladiopsis TaxID=1682393 RepID=A0A9P8XS67_9PEZI|nr:acyl transferase/acyl hydrolase/lysophospholipase [Microdochium trichocladiopsis]KAH7012172.1 acyl transferase/acyl hydrolase/lysophospholipase [Microdochium trichocladiopsis]
MACPPPLRVLSLDGGGIRGISSLLILENIMEQIRDAERLDHVPRPCDRFDLIGGTSTGGIIAIMLGRLGMTVDECIRAYRSVARQAFTPKTKTILQKPRSGAFSATALEAAIKQTVREFCVESECVERRRQGQTTMGTCPHGDALFRSKSCTKTTVLAITKDNVDAPPTLFKTYDTSTALDGCTIWQVARATSAATTFFKPIKVGRDEIEFIDAGFGYNNPCELLIGEAQRQFPDHGQMQVLSIGTGLGDVVEISSSWTSIIKALKQMATSSERVATELHDRYRGSGCYYRFNVEQGLRDVTLSDWEKSSTISAHTLNYLKKRIGEINTFVDSFVAIDQGGNIRSSQELTSNATGAGTQTQRMPAELGESNPHHYIPLDNNELFVGRENHLNQLKTLFDRRKRKIALVGLGGVGKTQVALQLAYWVKECRKEHSVFWLPALSDGSFEQACVEIASTFAIPTAADDNDARKALQRYLSSDAAGKWLLVVDNADDTRLLFGAPDAPGGIHLYLPKRGDGVTLFTTRSNEVAVSVGRNDVVELGEMAPKEANFFLTKSVVQQNLLCDEVATVKLLKKLTYLPLAITQAAAYLSVKRMPAAEYLELLSATEADAIGLMSEGFRDDTRYEGSQNTIATTWLVSFDQIRNTDPAAAKLLSFLSCIEAKGIPQSLLPQLGSAQQLASAIGTLCAYAFLVRRNVSKVFDMHRLVQLAARNQLRQAGHEIQEMREAVRHIREVFPDDDYENRDEWREYLPHAFRVLSKDTGVDSEERNNLSFWVGRCLRVDGRSKEAVFHLEETCRWRDSRYPEEHPDRLASQHALAVAYEADGQVKKAVELLEHVVTVQERTLAEDHPSQLASQHTLAVAYEADGQVKKAVEFLEQVVAVRRRTLAEDHPSRLASQHALAIAHQADGQVKKAVELLEQVVAVKGKMLAEDHPSRLASQHTLALAYEADGQVKKAVELLEQVVAVRRRTLAEDHPSRLASQHTLALAYEADGQVKKAVELLEHVVTVEGRTLAEDHPSRLASQHALALLKHDIALEGDDADGR